MRGPKTTLKLQKVTLTADGYGGQTETATTIANITGVLRPLKPSEDILFDKETITAQYRFYMTSNDISPYLSHLTAQNRFLNGSTVLKIKGVHNVMNAGKIYVADLEYVET